ncbi:MAG: DUF6089 family protein [Schleiferiaceae bacterium]|nr:DUF6089 family protein [Schleiferiaceae bacterium]
MRIKKALLLFVLGMFFITCFSQPFYRHNEIGMSLGTANISGDIANQSTINTLFLEARGQFSASYFRVLNPEQSIGFEANTLSYFASDFNHKNPHRGWQVQGRGQVVSLQIRHTFFGYTSLKLKPYVKAGVGAFRFAASVSNPEGVVNFPITQTRGVSFAMVAIPGIRYQITQNQSVSIEAILLFSNRDDWDVLYDEDRTVDKIGGIRFVYSIGLFY